MIRRRPQPDPIAPAPNRERIFDANRAAPRTRVRPLGRGTWPAWLLSTLLAGSASAQDAVRMHFAALPSPPSEASGGLHDASPGLNQARDRKVGRTANFGPLALSLEAVGSIEASDNVRVEPDGRPGVTASAGLHFDASYQVTKLQELSLQGTVSNRVPLSGPGRREQLFTVAPDSALRFNVWVRSLRLSPFIKYRRQLDPVASPVVSGTAILDQTAFTTGLQADLPLHQAGLQVLVLRERRSQQGDDALSQTAWSDITSLRVMRTLSPTNSLTADLGWVRTQMHNGAANRSTQVSTGLFDDWRLSPGLSLRAGAGLSRNRYLDSRVAGDVGQSTLPFYQFSVDHQLRENLSHELRYQHTSQEGVTTNFYRMSEFTWTPRYRFTQAISFDSTQSWQQIRESGPAGETATRWSGGLGLGYALTVSLGLRLQADRTVKRSDVRAREYTQNHVTFSFSQQF